MNSEILAASIDRLMNQDFDERLPLKEWSELKDFFDFMRASRELDEVIIYASAWGSGTFILNGYLLTSDALDEIPVQRRADWDSPMSNQYTCGLVYGGGEPPRVEFSVNAPRIADVSQYAAITLVHHRSFEASISKKDYYELDQFVTLMFDIHWMEERQAWCKLNDDGDIEDVAKLHRIQHRDEKGSTVITMQREPLEMYLSATDSRFAQAFDFTRWKAPFSRWPSSGDERMQEGDWMFSRRKAAGEVGGYSHGLFLTRASKNRYELGHELKSKDEFKEYESFIIYDFRHDRVTEISCDPKGLANYFSGDPEAPYELSPAFFRPEVLHKYRMDTEKYSIENRSISCRNSWYLKGYDINEVGQVHVYLVDLRRLPMSEQRYWKSFNEKPKSGISPRAVQTDFRGDWDTSPDPLRDLTSLAEKLERSSAEWFRLKDDEVLKRLYSPATTSSKEWDDSIILLAKGFVESLEKKFFKNRAIELGVIKPTQDFGSIRWALEFLKAKGVECADAEEATAPLFELQELRTKWSAHSSGRDGANLRASLLKMHKTPRNHVIALCARLHTGLRLIESTALS